MVYSSKVLLEPFGYWHIVREEAPYPRNKITLRLGWRLRNVDLLDILSSWVGKRTLLRVDLLEGIIFLQVIFNDENIFKGGP